VRLRFCTIAALGVSLAGPAAAQTYDPNYPVCLHLYGGSFTASYIDCSYTSIPQCQATASGQSAMCEMNPYYAGPPPARKHRPRRGQHPAN
jgi:hypothetical protein